MGKCENKNYIYEDLKRGVPYEISNQRIIDNYEDQKENDFNKIENDNIELYKKLDKKEDKKEDESNESLRDILVNLKKDKMLNQTTDLRTLPSNNLSENNLQFYFEIFNQINQNKNYYHIKEKINYLENLLKNKKNNDQINIHQFLSNVFLPRKLDNYFFIIKRRVLLKHGMLSAFENYQYNQNHLIILMTPQDFN